MQEMAVEKPQWTVLEDHLSAQPTVQHSYAVNHSFGRGSFRTLAENVEIPRIVLDKIVGHKSWTDQQPRGHGRAAAASRAPPLAVGGAAGATAAEVGSGSHLKPKSSGRAKALNLRAQKAGSCKGRRLGHHQVPVIRDQVPVVRDHTHVYPLN